MFGNLMGGMFSNKNNDDNNNKSDAFKKALLSLWKKLPLPVKLGILGGVAGLLVILIIVACLSGPSNFLDFSNDVKDNNDLEKSYKEYWDELCKEEDVTCDEKQIEAADRMRESQNAFYERLDALTNKYLSSNLRDQTEQRYVVLTTVFYGYEIDDLTVGDAFMLDESGNDDIDENNNDGKTVYEEEKDTLKELVKQFKTQAAFCYYDNGTDENGNVTRGRFEIKDENDETFVFNFFDKFRFNLGLYNEPEYQAAEKAKCTDPYKDKNPKPLVEEVNGGEASMDAFYKYLKESTYLDKKEHLKSYFVDYARSNNLTTDFNAWAEEDRIKVREGIVKDIKQIVDEAMVDYDKVSSTLAWGAGVGADTDYWWPIGSRETTTIDGVLFASGDPEYTGITSRYGPRWGGSHMGTDLEATGANGASYVIAARSGTVDFVFNTCNSLVRDGSCGYGWGNHIVITDSEGRQQRYAHLQKEYITVKPGDKVQQGQVLSRAGNSGDSYGIHLHFEVIVNGQRVDAEDYIDPNNPRPQRLYEPIDYIWPIGSEKTTKANGKLYAKDAPSVLGVTQDYNGVGHKGVDIEAFKDDPNDTAYVIAARGGTVVEMVNTCAPFEPDSSCGYGWGNHILIEDDLGRQERYAHLSKVMSNIKVGEKVEQGEVLGKAGNSGDSEATHLHFEMLENGNFVNPQKYIDIKKPRPILLETSSAAGFEKLVAAIDCFEGVTGGSADANGNYTVLWGADGVFTVGHGVTLEYNGPGFAKYGINTRDYMYSGAKIPKVIVDNVRTDVVKQSFNDVEKALTDNKIILTFEQKSALTLFKYNWGNIRNFISVYRQYNGNKESIRNNFFLAPSNIGDCYGCTYYAGLLTRRRDEGALYAEGVWRCYGNELKF